MIIAAPRIAHHRQAGQFVIVHTAEQTVRANVSLNPIMIDGTDMRGGCRVMVNQEMKLACVDGSEFDGHLVDFDLPSDRLTTYKKEECRLLNPLKDA
jgi:ferredoxin--NADP+ reductase